MATCSSSTRTRVDEITAIALTINIMWNILYNDWRSFVRKLHSLPCICEIPWEKCTVGQFGCYVPYPLPWASVLPLECHWLTQCTLGYHWATQRILAGYTGTPLEKLSWNSPHWNATGETLTFAAYTGTPLEGLWQPTQAPTQACRVASMSVRNDKMAGH